ncbi:unnamed protein product [Owenia fusiformis]|uniref:VWFC domain-containing protein n=1 Tax=Owenia fusiformis TaxID=6347 RepID=A0A8S4Q228_OWEFU|nr:unnamed protein product [Owenia fusiformis]
MIFKALLFLALTLVIATVGKERNRRGTVEEPMTTKETPNAGITCLNGQPKLNQMCSNRGWRIPCPNTYTCSKKDNFTCCQMNINGCLDPYLDKEGIPFKCRGGGSIPCPDGYRCVTHKANIFSICCRYITCTYKDIIHPQEAGQWYRDPEDKLDYYKCTKCECMSQDNTKCSTDVICLAKRVCKEGEYGPGPLMLPQEDGKCKKCTCANGKLECELCQLNCEDKEMCKKCKSKEMWTLSPCGNRKKCTTGLELELKSFKEDSAICRFKWKNVQGLWKNGQVIELVEVGSRVIKQMWRDIRKLSKCADDLCLNV